MCAARTIGETEPLGPCISTHPQPPPSRRPWLQRYSLGPEAKEEEYRSRKISLELPHRRRPGTLADSDVAGVAACVLWQ